MARHFSDRVTISVGVLDALARVNVNLRVSHLGGALIVVVLLPLITGCRAIVSESQRLSHKGAANLAVVQGTQLTLNAQLQRRDEGERYTDLTGTLTVRADKGVIPNGIELTHFSLRPAKAGFYVQNFTRKGDGSWQHIGSPPRDANLQVNVTRSEGTILVKFEWKRVGAGAFNKPANYDRIDVAVTLVDPAGKRHVLTNPAVPTLH